jgi:hypothetical protein
MGRIIQQNNGKTTVYVTGENLTGLTPESNTYYLGVDLSSGVLEKKNPNGTIVNLEDSGETFTGGTVNGATVFTNGLTSNIISATTYLNLPGDIYITGGTFSTGTLTLDKNDGNSVSVTGFTSDIYITGGTYSAGTLTLTSTDSNDVVVSGFTTENGEEWTGGTNYILVKAEGTDTENAAELQAAYDLAVSMNPNVTNRITVIAAPGNYNFSSNFVMNNQYIDLVSLDGNRNIIFNGNGTIDVASTDTLVRGVDVLTKSFKIRHNLVNLVVENCRGGDESFGYADSGTTLTINGTFIDCVAGNNSFGHRPNIGGSSQINLNINGVFTNCTAGNNSFGYNTNNQVNSPTNLTFNSAKLTNCTAGNNSFGVHISPRVGSVTQFNFSKFTNCKSGNDSFGYINNSDATIQSTSNLTIFENCEAGNNSFCTGLFNTSNVIFKNCVSGDFSFFGDGTLTGKFENCQGGDGSFGYDGDVSGTFTNCIGGGASFGGGGGVLTGNLYYCRLTSGTFPTVSGGGVTVLCIDGNNQINTQN